MDARFIVIFEQKALFSPNGVVLHAIFYNSFGQVAKKSVVKYTLVLLLVGRKKLPYTVIYLH